MLFQNAREAFLKNLDVAAVATMITEAERKTTADIRVAVLLPFRGTIDETTERTVRRLGMTATKERNGVLIAIDPERRQFRIWGDEAIHEKVGDTFWRETAAAIQGRFRAGDFIGGVALGISTAGRSLAEHFPCDPGGRHVDQLPNAVDIGE